MDEYYDECVYDVYLFPQMDRLRDCAIKYWTKPILACSQASIHNNSLIIASLSLNTYLTQIMQKRDKNRGSMEKDLAEIYELVHKDPPAEHKCRSRQMLRIFQGNGNVSSPSALNPKDTFLPFIRERDQMNRLLGCVPAPLYQFGIAAQAHRRAGPATQVLSRPCLPQRSAPAVRCAKSGQPPAGCHCIYCEGGHMDE